MRHSSAIHLAAAVPLALSLAACAAGAPRTIANQFVTYRHAEYVAAASNRDMKVIVRGNPFDVSQAELDKLVTANMHARRGNLGTNFTTGQTTNADPAYEIVWLFNGPMTTQANELCMNPAGFATQPGPAAQLRGLVAFCRFNRAASWVDGWLDGGPQGVSHDGFNRLVQQMTRELFPVVGKDDPRPDSGRCRRFIC